MKSTIVSKTSIFNPLNVGDTTPIFVLNNSFNADTDYIELHIQPSNSDVIIKSHFDYNRYSLSKSYGSINNTFPEIDIDPILDLAYYGYVSGEYTTYYNFFRKLFSKDLSKYFFIKEISSSRTEVRIASNSLTNSDISINFERLSTKLKSINYMYPLVLNLGSNVVCQVLDVALDTSENNYSLLLLLDDPIPTDISVNRECWLLESLSLSTKYEILLVNSLDTENVSTIKGPNFSVVANDTNSYTTAIVNTAELNSLTDQSSGGFDNSFSNSFLLYGTLLNLDQNSLGKLLNLHTNTNISINVDFTKFENFVHFSSAEDRIINFVNKIKSIEELDQKISDLMPIATTIQGKLDIAKYSDEKLNIIKLFDKFEFYLYFENNDVAYPKIFNDKPYLLQSTTSAQFWLWYNDIIEVAQLYDNNNPDYIWKALPEYIKNDIGNTNLKLFVDGIGHYYDNIWVYIKSIGDIYVNSNNPTKGISKDLVKDMLVSFGVTLYNNTDETSLTSDMIGNNEGELNIGNFGITSQQEYDKEIYKRIYHNLPLLLKSKGTAKSIRTLLSIYGIPAEILSPKLNLSSFPSNIAYRDTKNINAIMVGNTFGYVSTKWKQQSADPSPKSIRFNVFLAWSFGELLSVNKDDLPNVFDLSVHLVDETFRFTLRWNSTTSTLFIPRNDKLCSVTLTHDQNVLKLYVVNKNILYSTSISMPNSVWNGITDEFVTTLGANMSINVYVNSYRHYSTVIDNDTALAHHRNPLSMAGNNPFQRELVLNSDIGLKNELGEFFKTTLPQTTLFLNYINIMSYYSNPTRIFRYKPFKSLNTTSSTIVFGYLYNGTDVNSVYISKNPLTFNDTTHDAISKSYGEFTVDYFAKHIEGVQDDTDINDNLLLHNVNQQKFEAKENMLDVSISRSSDINNDMIDYLDSVDINSYFGSPGDLYSDTYKEAKLLRKAYFNNNTVNYSNIDYNILAKYIKTSLYKMINDFVPAGSNVITGLSVQPLFTDRSKYRYHRNVNESGSEDHSATIGNIDISGETNIDIIDLSLTDRMESVGNNKFITHKVTNNREFLVSNDNTLYGNIFANTTYQPHNLPNNICKLYKLTNYSTINNQYVMVTLFGETELTRTQIYKNSVRYICSSTYPVHTFTLHLPVYAELNIELVNRYGCSMVEVAPNIPAPIEYQEYYNNLSSYNLARYDGSKTTSKLLNVWSEGDKSYGKTAAIDSYVNHVGLFTRVYSGSIGNSLSNLTMKYLVDSEGSFIELNELNRNLFDVQNIFGIRETATISLFNPLQFSNQKNTNGIKDIFSSGYYYKPVLYYNENDLSIKFETDEEDMYSRFRAINSGSIVYSRNSPDIVDNKPKLNSTNSYDIFNIFDDVKVNSYNTYKTGSIVENKFPSYTIIDDTMKYSFNAKLSVFVDFVKTSKTPVRYSLEVVKSLNPNQSISDQVIYTSTVSIIPGYKVTAQDDLFITSIQGSIIDSGIQINLNSLYDDENNINIPAGSYTVYSIPTYYIFPEGSTFYSVYGDNHFFHYISYLGRYYKTGESRKGQLAFLYFTSSLEYFTSVSRIINVKTDWIKNLQKGNSIYFRLRKLDTNPTLLEAIISGGLASVDIEIDELSGGAVPIVESVQLTDTLILNRSISSYYGFTQLSTNQELIDKYGIIEGTFFIKPYDIITIKHTDSSKKYTFLVTSAYLNNDGKVAIKLNKNLPANIIYAPNSIEEFVISSRTVDETNVILSFSKSAGETSYGILIPKNINPKFMDNIDVITKQIKEKVINETSII